MHRVPGASYDMRDPLSVTLVTDSLLTPDIFLIPWGSFSQEDRLFSLGPEISLYLWSPMGEIPASPSLVWGRIT